METPTDDADTFIKKSNERADARIALLVSSDHTSNELHTFSKKIAHIKLHLIMKILSLVVIILLLVIYALQKYI